MCLTLANLLLTIPEVLNIFLSTKGSLSFGNNCLRFVLRVHKAKGRTETKKSKLWLLTKIKSKCISTVSWGRFQILYPRGDQFSLLAFSYLCFIWIDLFHVFENSNMLIILIRFWCWLQMLMEIWLGTCNFCRSTLSIPIVKVELCSKKKKYWMRWSGMVSVCYMGRCCHQNYYVCIHFVLSWMAYGDL